MSRQTPASKTPPEELAQRNARARAYKRQHYATNPEALERVKAQKEASANAERERQKAQRAVTLGLNPTAGMDRNAIQNAERRALTAKKRAAQERWRAANPEKYAERLRVEKEAQRETGRAADARMRAANPDKYPPAATPEAAALRERKRLSNAAWRAANPDKVKASRERFRGSKAQRNADYYSRYREEDLEQKRQKRISDKAEAARRKKNAESARARTKANPEKRREAVRLWRANNPEKDRQSRRDGYYRNREKILQQAKEHYAQRDPDESREIHRRKNESRKPGASTWKPTEAQREQRRVQSGEAQRIARSLERAGLPPRQLHRTLVPERRRNDVAAAEFFTRKRNRAEVARVVYGDIDPVTGTEQQEWAAIVAKIRQRVQVRAAVQKYIRRHGPTIREEIAMDSRARELRGKGPLDPDLEFRLRVRQATSYSKEPAPQDPNASQVQAPARPGRRQPAAGDSAPHTLPGGRAATGPRLN